MSRIASTFAGLRGRRPALIGFVTAGFPDGKTCLRLALALVEHCDILEIGIPFSDPVMDGPVLQETAHLALENGFRLEHALLTLEALRRSSEKPLLFMTYYNPVFRRGAERFAAEAREAGADGVLVADLPPEEGDEWAEAARMNGLDRVLFASPTTPDERLDRIDALGSGFLYCISTLGTTGPRERLDEGLGAYVERVRSRVRLPLALGIGITTPQHCREAGGLADGVIVGSHFMRSCLEALRRGEDPEPALRRAAAEMRLALESPGP
jgi:tryptophan synthase alpha chain